jgi:uncharacterized membrane protein SpoIIM required for sporulation
MTGVALPSTQFRREREATWRALERLVEKIESGGLRSLSPQDLQRLPLLYRATLSSLSVARAISLDRNGLDYLEALSARAYVAVYGARRGFFATAKDFFARRLPRTIRRTWRAVTVAAAATVLGAVVAGVLVARDADRYYDFIDESMAQGRDPAASTESLRAALYSPAEEAGHLTAFASFLFTHNAQIGLLAFGLGFVAGAPTLLLLIVNGLTLGAFAALYGSRSLSVELWAWLLPHGIPEIFAVVLCGAAGFVVAHAMLFPGRRTRLQSLAARGRDAGVLVVGAVCLLFLAGLVEGIFRQAVNDVSVRYVVATAMAAGLTAYVGFAGRSER